jgi:hypothetical protein
MGAAYVAGWHTALRQRPLVLVLFVANLVFGVLFAATAGSWLSLALDASLATRTLLTDVDLNVFVDLFVHHGGGLRMLLIGGGALAGLFALLGIWTSAVTVAAVGEPRRLAGCLHRGLELYPRYFRLWVITMLLDAASITAAVLISRGLTRWTAESAAELTYYWCVAAGASVGAALLLVLTTVHDHARIRCARADIGAARAYMWAFGFVCRREARAAPLAMLLLATGFAVWVVYQTVGMLIVPASAFGLTLSLLWGEMLLLGRMLLRVWFFAAETALQTSARTTTS